MKLLLSEILQATRGRLERGNPHAVIHAISTDTRTLKPNELFICLEGPQFDGHAFLEQALQKGAAGVLIDQKKSIDFKGLKEKSTAFWIEVDSPLRALGDLAQAWRKKFSLPLIAITGSNGKTTTKDMTVAILSEEYPTLATEGNLNNLIGLPKMLFQLDSHHRAAVLEMGMNQFKEIDRLAEIAQPTLGLITNIGEAHIENLKSREGIAQAKGELFQRLPSHGIALVNQNDEWIPRLPTPAQKITFGIQTPADVNCIRYQLEEESIACEILYQNQRYEFEAAVVGIPNLKNLVSAVAIGFALQLNPTQMQKALRNFKTRALRLELIPLQGGMTLLNDCYNANPSSMEGALQTLASLKKTTPGVAVLGEMFELGDYAPEGHRRVGKAVAAHQIEFLIAVGKYASDLASGAIEAGMTPKNCFAAQSQEEIVPALKDWIPQARTVLVKGSRGAKMEKVSEFIQDLFPKEERRTS